MQAGWIQHQHIPLVETSSSFLKAASLLVLSKLHAFCVLCILSWSKRATLNVRLKSTVYLIAREYFGDVAFNLHGMKKDRADSILNELFCVRSVNDPRIRWNYPSFCCLFMFMKFTYFISVCSMVSCKGNQRPAAPILEQHMKLTFFLLVVELYICIFILVVKIKRLTKKSWS